MTQFENVLPIRGIQKMDELEQWLSFMQNSPEYTEEINSFVEKDRKEFGTDFCRGFGYCMPCPQQIQINTCARISQLLRRAPDQNWTTEYWQKEMNRINSCTAVEHARKNAHTVWTFQICLKKIWLISKPSSDF